MSKPKRPSASRMPILSRISLCVTAAITPFSVVAQQAPAPKASEEQRVQRSDADKVDELVVTATRRSASAQAVPVALSAFSGEQLAEQAVSNSQELLLKVPSSDITMNNGSTAANIYIRGVGTKGPGYNQVAAVGIYVDEVSLNSPIVNVLQLFDLQRVEVLRGPQNTLYGRNTTGGAVNFVSVKPRVADGTWGYLTLTGGQFSQADVEGAVSFDLGQEWAARLALIKQTRDGMYNNSHLGEKVYDKDSTAVRAQLVWSPRPDTELLMKLHGEKVNNTNKLWKTIGLQSPLLVGAVTTYNTPCQFTIGLGSACVGINNTPSDPNDTRTFSASMRSPIEQVNARGASLNANWKIGDVRATAISGYEYNNFKKAEDVDAGPAPLRPTGPFSGSITNANYQGGFDFFQVSEASQYSQELRLASEADKSLRWITGLFWFKEKTIGNTTAFSYFAGTAANGGRANSTNLNQENRVASGYGEIEFDVTKQLTVTAGIRATREELSGTNTTVQRSLTDAVTRAALLPTSGQRPITTAELLALPVGTGRNVYVDTPFEKSFSQSGGKLGVKYSVDAQTMVFGTVSQGFKSGSYSAAPAQSINGSFFTPTNPETLTAYEIGLKTTTADRKLKLNLTGYYYQYKDQQLLRTTSLPGLGIVAAQVNAGKSNLQGVELEAQWAPGGGWNIDLGVGYLKTKIVEFTQDEACVANVGGCPASGVRKLDFSGQELTNSPRLTTNLTVRKEWKLDGGNTLSIGGDYSYRAKRFFNIPNNTLESSEAYSLVNAQATYRFGAKQQYRLTAWGKNLNDKVYFLNKSVFAAAGTMEALIGDPRTFGLTFSTNY
ncbi:MAG: TonB-dependent receptor [Betaproteobacteria bacterium]|jgi:iron complex outermembrane receptor protein